MKNKKIIKICSSIGSLVGLFLLFFILSGQQASASMTITQTTWQSAQSFGSITDGYAIKTGQSFVVDEVQNLNTLVLMMARWSGDANGYITIESDDSGSPSGSVLCTSDTITNFDSAGFRQEMYNFTGCTLQPSTIYWMVAQSSNGGAENTNYVSLATNGSGSSVYADGRMKIYTGSWLTGGALNDWYFIFNGVASVPPSYDYVQYNYSQGQADIVADHLDWNFSYNVCDTGYPPTGGKVYVTLQGDIFGEGTPYRAIIGDGYGPWQCQGTFNLSEDIDSMGVYGTSSVYIKMDTYDASSTLIQSVVSPSWTAHNLPEIIEVNGWVKYSGVSPIEIDLSTEATTTIMFDYNICQVDNWASSTFWLWNESTGGNTLYNVGVDGFVGCSGYATIEYTHGTSTDFQYDWFAQIRLENEDLATQIISNGFEINMFTSAVVDQTPMSVQELFGKSTSELACTSDEWAEASASSTPWYEKNFFNLTRIKCNSALTFFNFIDNVIGGFELLFQNTIMKLRYLFPLNIPTKILESWTASKVASLSTDLELLDVAETDGSIKGYLPHEWIGRATDTTPVIFSQDFISNGNANYIAMMVKIRKLTSWFQWVLFTLGLLLWSKSIYADLKGYNHSETEYLDKTEMKSSRDKNGKTTSVVYNTKSKNRKYKVS